MTRSPVRQMTFDESRYEWYTPDWIMKSVHAVMSDGIDFDPASSAIANLAVQARAYMTKEDDALATAWPKNVRTIYMNPPYNTGLIMPFCEKFIYQLNTVGMDHGIVVINNATETKYFQLLLEYATHVCFPRKRIIFNYPDGTSSNGNTRGQAIFYFSSNHDFYCANRLRKCSFVDEFAHHGATL